MALWGSSGEPFTPSLLHQPMTIEELERIVLILLKDQYLASCPVYPLTYRILVLINCAVDRLDWMDLVKGSLSGQLS